MSAAPAVVTGAAALADAVTDACGRGARFAALMASAHGDGSTTLRALVAGEGDLRRIESRLDPGAAGYPSLTPRVPSAAWYEREIRDLFGLTPDGHPRLDPLVLPLAEGAARPRPGSATRLDAVALDPTPLGAVIGGEGVFTIPYGPVRSGVFESVEYLVETSGEEIPNLRTRVHHKHRGLETRFGELSIDDGVLLAERVEGAASVAHATAYAQALEAMAAVEPPEDAQWLRLVHAELERVAAHLDSMIRHAEAAGQAVAYARLTLHKERVQRLRARLCGHRFGRGVVVPGGVAGAPMFAPADLGREAEAIERDVLADVDQLATTASFLDRLKGTGPVPPDLARSRGALGPVGRGSGCPVDVRVERPYGAYRSAGFEPAFGQDAADALARQSVRAAEIAASFRLVAEGAGALGAGGARRWRVELPPLGGCAVSSVEAPHGELIYLVEAEDDRLVRVKPRCASFHNLALFPDAFRGDIFTDFAFIEASFGLSIAGVSG